jgi:hypothetical protein
LLQYLSLHNVLKVLPGNIHTYSLLLGQEYLLYIGVIDMSSKLRIHFCEFLSNLPRIPFGLLVLRSAITYRLIVLLTFAVVFIVTRIIIICILIFSTFALLFLIKVQD